MHFYCSSAGGTKKGANHVICSVKLVKTIGAVTCMNIDHRSGHLAVGSDQGNVRCLSSVFLKKIKTCKMCLGKQLN